jgi:hypothetical protein
MAGPGDARDFGFPSIERLVDVLQHVHDQKVRRSGEAEASPDVQTKGFDVIRQSTSGNRDTGRPLRAENYDGTERSRRYRELQSELARVEARAKRRSDAASISAARMRPDPGAFCQETLYLRCRRFDRTAGRFRCDNFRGRRTEVRLSGNFATRSDDFPVHPRLHFSPERFALEAGQSTIVSVEVDCSECGETPQGPLSASANVLMDEAIALKLWIEVDLYDLE